ncbi:histidine kinase N-terminal 7TM domain-containing protein [Halosegnis marinus]|uniref:histidine kinase N-terminal 7TM domain-containing protein n=1 Tax=Halosegnis marinus TaxID=3034023 RepID=UPI003611B961
MDPLRVGYVALFAATAVLCVAVVPRTRLVAESDTRRGLAALLLVSGVWAAVGAAQVFVDGAALKRDLYTLGLVLGFAGVGAWLSFCSAYAGRDLHRDVRVRAVAVGFYALVVAVKVTNPLHGQYFAATLRTEPFPHLAVTRLPLDWAVTATAYLLAGYGFLLLYRTLRRTDYRSRSLWVIVALAAFPVVPGVASALVDLPLLDLGYEPLGVALFAVGALYFVEEKFLAVRRFGRDQLLDEIDDAVLVLDTEDRLVESNAAARAAFPALADGGGEPLAEVAPTLAGPAGDTGVVTAEVDGGTRHYVRRSNSSPSAPRASGACSSSPT